MVRRVRLGQTGEFIVLAPVEFAGIDDDAAHDRPVTADELRRRVDNDVGPVLDGAQQIGRREGAVDDQGDAVGVGDGSNGFEVNDIGIGVA